MHELSADDQEKYTKARALMREAADLRENAKLELAKQKYTEASELLDSISEPRPVVFWYFLGICHLGAERYDDAISCLNRHLELSEEKKPSDSRNPISWWVLAVAQAEAGDLKEAHELYTELSTRPQPPPLERLPFYKGIRERLEKLIGVDGNK